MQTQLFKKTEHAYGGEYFKKRKGRQHGRPLAVNKTMHLVLRSSLARGKWSFLESRNKQEIRKILKTFAEKYGVKLLFGANVGNHIHLQIKLSNRHTYKPFIRAVTSAIAMKITGVSRWITKEQLGIKRFWDLRPFTRIIVGWKAQIGLRDYIAVNRLEGKGIKRDVARVMIARMHDPPRGYAAT